MGLFNWFTNKSDTTKKETITPYQAEMLKMLRTDSVMNEVLNGVEKGYKNTQQPKNKI